MPTRFSGLFWCATFVLLDAAQAVFMGGALQNMDSFLVGLLVFGSSSLACLALAPWYAPGQIGIALDHPRTLVILNLCTAGGWISYLIAVQMIEPAVVVTVFSGAIPLALLSAAALGVGEAEPLANALERSGNAIIALAILVLSAVTLGGWSGFLRGGLVTGAAGLLLTLVSGVMMAGMLLCSYRMSRHGVGPAAMLGVRFPLYVAVAAAGVHLGVEAKDAVAPGELAWVFAVGLLLLAFPIYAVQKAVTLASALTLGAASALIPVAVFAMQIVEGRVDYSRATLGGLAIYMVGAIVAAAGRLQALERDRTRRALG